MRPRKKVLLLIADEIQLSLWRMRLEVRGYAVLAARELSCALELAHANPDCVVAVTNVAGSEGAEGVAALYWMRALLFGVKAVPDGTLFRRVEVEFPAGNLPERVLNAVRELAARKRGPKPKPRDPVNGMQPTVATLLDEALHAAEPDVGAPRAA